MTWHLYTTPVVLFGTGDNASRVPKYIGDNFLTPAVSWSMIDYGYQPTSIAAADVTTSQDNSIAGKPEVIPVPTNLDGQVGSSALNTLKSKLAANMVPETWIVATTPYREILRMINAISILLLRYAIMNSDPNPPFGSLTLDSLYSALPAGVQTGLRNACLNMGLSASAFVGTNTLRVVLQSVGDQMKNVGRTVGGITF